jgi:hypothetical protein
MAIQPELQTYVTVDEHSSTRDNQSSANNQDEADGLIAAS